MTVKEFIQLFRDRVLIAFMLYAFTLEVFLAGSGVSFELRNAQVLVHDADHSAASRELIHRFQPPHFRIIGEVFDQQRAIELLDKGEAMIVLDIPPKFEESLLRGRPASVQMQVDTANPILGFLASSYAERIVAQFGLEISARRHGLSGNRLQAAPVLSAEQRVWFNPNQNDAWFMSVVEMLNLVTMFAILLPAAAMAREKERGTIEQLLVSPLTPFEIMVPKIVSMTAVILLGILVTIFVILKPCFGVPFRGSLGLFMGISALYVFTTAGLGLILASIAHNLTQVGMLAALIFVPMVFLSGAWTPPENMPVVLQAVSVVSPLHHYINASLGIMLRGNGLDLLWDSVLGIAIFGAVTFGIGIARFRRQFS